MPQISHWHKFFWPIICFLFPKRMPLATKMYSSTCSTHRLFWSLPLHLPVAFVVLLSCCPLFGPFLPMFCLANTSVPLDAAAVPKQRELLEHLFERYRKELRPVYDESTVTEVSVQLYFKQIQKVKENDQIITVYCWLEEYWHDEFLRWDPARFGGITQLHIPVELIWRPDLLVYNNANMNVRESEMMTNALVQHDGRVSLFRAIITDITCHLNLHRFPFDQQICYLMLASWSYDGSQVMIRPAEEDKHLWTMGGMSRNASNWNLTASASSIHSTGAQQSFGQQPFMKSTSLTHYIPNMEWSLIDFKTRSNLKNPSYYLFTLIMPSALITTITVVGFFTPHSTTGENTEKVSLGVTSLLSLALILMMVSDKLPATSDTVPVLGQYYIGLICIQFTATYVTTWTLGLQMQGNSGRSLPRRLRLWLMSVNVRNNFFMRHLLGHELRTAQQSIRHRMRKFDKMRKGFPAYVDDRPSFLYRPSSTVPLVTNHAVVQLDQQNGTAGAGSPLLKISEHEANNNSVNKQNHVCGPFEQNQNESQQKLLANEANNRTASNLEPIREIVETVHSIKYALLTDEQLRQIRYEWQMICRMIEKVMKLAFSIFTITFAVYMLYDEQAPPLITEEWILAHSH